MRTLRFFTVGLFCAAVLILGIVSCSQSSIVSSDPSAELAFSLESGTYGKDIAVALATHGNGAVVRYTLDGSEPDGSSDLYTGPVEIPAYGEPVVLKAAVFRDGSRGQTVYEREYTVSVAGRVATPKLSPRKGRYDHPIEVTISCATAGAVIRYTTDGTGPLRTSPIYTGPIPLPAGSDTVIKAAATKEGLKVSTYAIGEYIIAAAQPVDRAILFGSNRNIMTHPDLDPNAIESGTDGQRVLELYRMEPDGQLQIRLTTAVFDPVSRHFLDFSGDSDWSPDGTKIVYTYLSEYNDQKETLYVMNADGTGSVAFREFFRIDGPRWSPDGQKICFRIWDGTANPSVVPGLYTVNSDFTGLTLVREEDQNLPEFISSPSWSPDSQKIVYAVNDTLCIVNADGTGDTVIPGHAGEQNNDPDWHPSLNLIVYSGFAGGQNDLFAMTTDGTVILNVTDSPADEFQPDWSPDGTKIAFTTNKDGNFEVYSLDAGTLGQADLTNNPAFDFSPSW